MKMKMRLFNLATIMAVTTASSSAAVTITFTEVGGDVVMEAAGSLDVTGATLTQEDENTSFTNLGQGDLGIVVQFLQIGDSSTPNPIEYFYGTYLTPMFDYSSEQTDGAGNIMISGVATGPSNFGVLSNGVIVLGDYGQTILVDGGANHTIYDVAATATFSGQTFESMGLDHHNQDVPIEIWKASSGAGEAGTMQFVVSSVPEPSVAVLSFIGAVGLLRRRR